VFLPVKATQVAAGANHSAILGTNGIAYTFGANDVGQCGVPSDRNPDDEDDEGGPVFGPRPVHLPENAGKVVRVSAVYMPHTVLTTESGRIFVFRQNDSGQLGVGVPTPMRMAAIRRKRIQNLSKVPVWHPIVEISHQ
jgi:alpha-tubulin suppressor-like RCC1 family protein